MRDEGKPARAWRSDGSETAPAAKSKPSVRAAGAGRGWKLFALLGTILVLCGAALAWLLLLRGFNEPLFLALPITEYRDPGLPANAWAEKDSAALKPHFPNGHKAFNFQERLQLERVLHGLRNEQSGAIVVYLAAHATMHDGQVFILPGDARLGQPDGWIPLSEVVDSLGLCRSPNRLLILDVMHPIAKPASDVPDNEMDIARQVHDFLKNELHKDDKPPLWVLCACGPGQGSQVSEKLGLSVFAHHLHQGLNGAAAGYYRKRQDGFVSVKDLAEFVADRVESWAETNEFNKQRPVLLGRGQDFHLVRITGQPQPER